MMSRRLLTAVTVLVAAAAGLLPTTSAAASSRPGQSCDTPTRTATVSRQIVRLRAGADPAAVAAAVHRCGTVLGVQGAVGLLVADLPADRVTAVEQLPGVAQVTADYPVRAQSLGFSPSTQAGAMTNVTRITGATGMWQKGYTGSGIDVAVIDTGVAPVSGLKDAAKVVVGPDLSFESQDVDLRFLDTYGHGTHMAGIIAGREVAKGSGSSYAADTTNFYGMAPDARLVSLKLADRNGAVDVSQLIAAIDWVVQNRRAHGLNIRVLNLSYGTWSMNDPTTDPLSWAAEVAWRSGIVVVSSAGNEGDTKGGVTAPAYNAWLIAVGAADTQGTTSMSDDTVASFSARQGGSFPDRGIDLVAPGAGVISLGVPGSSVYDSYPSARVGNGFLRGSGTSQAAAVVSGATALLLQQRPYLNPDQVKALLVAGATKLAAAPVTKQGNGELNLATSSSLAVPTTTQVQPTGTGDGRLESTRNKTHVVMNGKKLTGAVDIFGNPFDTAAAAALAGSGTAWGADGTFNGSQWIGTGFTADTTGWAGKTWGGKTWSGKTWSGKTWSGESWSALTWSNAVWTGSAWSAASWTSTVGSDTWAGAVWTTKNWG